MLVERFGAGRTLGEAYATSYALRVIREGGLPSVADIAITDPLWAYRHLEAMAEIIGCTLDLPRRR